MWKYSYHVCVCVYTTNENTSIIVVFATGIVLPLPLHIVYSQSTVDRLARRIDPDNDRIDIQKFGVYEAPHVQSPGGYYSHHDGEFERLPRLRGLAVSKAKPVLKSPEVIVYPIILQAAAGCCGVSVVVPAQHECDGAKMLGRSARADGGGVPSMSTDTQPDVHSVQSTAVRAAGRRGMRCGRGDDGAGQRPPPQRCIGRSVGRGDRGASTRRGGVGDGRGPGSTTTPSARPKGTVRRAFGFYILAFLTASVSQ